MLLALPIFILEEAVSQSFVCHQKVLELHKFIRIKAWLE
jgi:hypothetical protein